MLFTEPVFAIFFAVYLALHLVIPFRFRIYLVIFGGIVFYAWWRVSYLWVPLLLTGLAWTGASWIAEAGEPTSRKRRLVAAVVAIFLPLAIVKYTHFVAFDVIGHVIDPEDLGLAPDAFRWALPLGISFITFTVAAYVFDVYRRRYAPGHDVRVLLGYVLFFPHLIAGPILRPHELMPQLEQARAALGARFLAGIMIFTLGAVKKLVFADQLAAVVEPAFAADAALSSTAYVLAVYAFSVQIYCDFSGYTDMAIGIAYMLRIRLPTNFLRPYCATSVIDFWRRWHITLSHWLRDYLYIPLGGNRHGRSRQLVNLMLTMLIGGLWHGANWTFVVWGGLHGASLAFNHVAGRHLALPRWLSTLLTFHWVTFLWIFFRAPDLGSAWRVISGIAAGNFGDLSAVAGAHAFAITLILVFFAGHGFDRHAFLRIAPRRTSKPILWACLAFAWVLAITLSQGSSAKFIYFDF